MTSLPGRPLRLAYLGDFDGPHTRRWLKVFVERGHDVHAVSYYEPQTSIPDVTLHVLRDISGRRARFGPSEQYGWTGEPPRTGFRIDSLPSRLKPPPPVMRALHAMRYRLAGLPETLRAIRPDVFHAHFAVEHGFYGAFAGVHPYVISCWGSDIFVESKKLIDRALSRHALSHADYVTATDAEMARQIRRLGVPESKVAVIQLGLEREYLPDLNASVNLQPESGPLTVISTRALEPHYNVDRIIRAFAIVHRRLPDSRLIVAHRGSEAGRLHQLSSELNVDGAVEFTGTLSQSELRDRLLASHVYVSVPNTDAFAISNLEALACGATPIVSNLRSADGWIEAGKNGYRTIDDTVESLAGQMHDVLLRADFRREAALLNRKLVEERGMLDTNMLTMERIYYKLAGVSVS